MAVAALLTVFTGFAPSYYLGHFFEAPPVSTLVHLHGVLFASWILLFLTQTPALARMPFIGPGGPLVFFGATDLFVAACLIYDRLAHGRGHPAFLWGGLFFILSQPLRLAIGGTGAWRSFAEW